MYVCTRGALIFHANNIEYVHTCRITQHLYNDNDKLININSLRSWESGSESHTR